MDLARRASLTALAAISMTAAGCSNEQTSSAPTSSTRGNPPADQTTASAPPRAAGNGIDRAFVAAMVPHHQAAVTMSRIARQRGTSQFVRRIARDIMASHGKEISTMRLKDAALAAAGAKRGSLGVPGPMVGMKADTATLEAADPMDAVFLRRMVAHHRDAIEIAKIQLAKGQDPELRVLAGQIIRAQRRELGQMRRRLAIRAVRRTPPARPPGPRDPWSGSPDMPGIDDSGRAPRQSE
jgi:uncharacterized protein (DUF305 family)